MLDARFIEYGLQGTEGGIDVIDIGEDRLRLGNPGNGIPHPDDTGIRSLFGESLVVGCWLLVFGLVESLTFDNFEKVSCLDDFVQVLFGKIRGRSRGRGSERARAPDSQR